MIKNGLIILLFLLPVIAFAQYPNNPNKIRLGFQTTGNGLIYRGSGAPTLFPTGYNSAFQFYDTIANTLWVYQDSFWYLTNTIRRSTPPPYSSVSSGLTLVYGHGVWQDTDDYHRYEYVANDSIEAWVPATGTYYWPSEPSDIAATGSTGAVKYTAGLWHKVPTDSLFRYDGSDWVFIGAGGINYLNGDAGTVQDIQQGDTIKVLGGYGMNTSAGATDAVTVTADTAQLATPYDVSVVQDDINAHELADGDLSATNEIQQIDTLSLSGTTLSASLSSDGAAAKTVNLSPILSGYVTGSGTAGRVPRWTSSSALGDGVLRDDGSLLAINGVTVSGYSLYDYGTSSWRLPVGTTAQQPTGQAGAFRYNSTVGIPEYHNGTRWNYTAPAAGAFTATRVPFVNANLQLTDDADLTWDNTNNRLTIARASATNTSSLTLSNSTGTGTARLDFKANTGSSDIDGATVFLTGSSYSSPYTNAFGFWNYEAGDFALGLASNEVFRVKAITGNAGFGTQTPVNKVDIEGGLAVGATYSGSSTAPTNGAIIEGTVGIGTSSPSSSYRLHVSGSPQTIAYFNSTSAGTTRVAINHSANTGIGLFIGGVEKWTVASYLPSGTNYDFSIYNSQTSTASVFIDGDTDNFGIKTTSPARTLHVTGEARITDLTTDTPTQIVGADADGDLGSITVGSGLSLSAGTLTATGTGTMSSFTLAGSSGTPQTIENGNTLTIEAGYGMTTTAAATDKVTVAADTTKLATLYDVTAIGNTLYTGNGTIATDRTVTINSGQTLRFSGPSSMAPGFDYDFDLGYDDDDFGLDGLSFYGFGDTTQAYIYAGVYSNTSAQWGMGVSQDIAVSSSLITGDEAGSVTMSGSDGSDAATVTFGTGTAVGYGPRVYGSNGVEFDTGGGGSIVSQINNTTETTLTSTGLGLGDTSPEKELDVAGMGKFRQISGQDNTPSIGTNANMGTGRSASITSGHSSDVAGRISFTSGTTLTAGEWVTLTWGTAFDNAPAVVLMPENANAASIVPYLYVVPSTTGVSIVVNVTGAPYEGLTFEFNYIVIQGK